MTSASSKKVLVALSGGVDSAVSAALLVRAGYEVEAVFMVNWSSTDGLVKAGCPWLDDRREALRVAAHLGVPLHTFNFEEQFSMLVMEHFFAEYAAGRTPNPDVACNKEIKFKLLYDEAMARGFDFLATGHYAQVLDGKLVQSKDRFKDQTYFIYNLSAEQLGHVLFPVGGYLKSEVRDLAHEFDLPNADRKESMGICFVGNVRLAQFLAQRVPAKVGAIVGTDGAQLGTHSGAHSYTLGQRDGLNIGGTGPYYVVGKDLASNTLVVSKDSSDPALMSRHVELENVHWIGEAPSFPFRCTARFRHQQELQQVTVSGSSVTFDVAQRAPTPGQSLVLYKEDVCLGGGIIV